MREKAAISWKEAMEEGRRFRENSVSSNDDDDVSTSAIISYIYKYAFTVNNILKIVPLFTLYA